MAAALLGAAFLPPLTAAPASAQSLESPVKATFLYRFGDFVAWPERVFADAQSPMNICLVGDDPFGEVLNIAAEGQHSNGRPIELYRLETLEPQTGCHVAYIAGSRAQTVAEALRAAESAPMLTVTDAAFSDARGMVHFEVVEDRVRFHVDEQAAAERELTVSSRLLGVALTVRRRAAP